MGDGYRDRGMVRKMGRRRRRDRRGRIVGRGRLTLEGCIVANARTYVCENEWGCDVKESENEEREKGEEDCFFRLLICLLFMGEA